LNIVPSGTFVFSGVIDWQPRHGPVQGNTTIYFDSFGFENYDSLDCVFEDQTIQPIFLDVSGAWACVTPVASRSPQNNIITIVGHYQNFLGSTVFSEELATVVFDFGLPAISSFSSLSTVFGSSSQSITIKGDYFNGGLETGLYECRWQTGAVPSSDLPLELGSQPTFSVNSTLSSPAVRVLTTGSRDGAVFQDFEIVCSTPASFPQIGEYPFELVFSDSAIRDFYLFSVVAQPAALSSTSSDNGFVYDFAAEYFQILGSGFAGGRLLSSAHSESYLCRFGSTSANPLPDIISVGSYINDSSIECLSAPRNLTLDVSAYFETNRNLLNSQKNPSTCPSGSSATKVNCLKQYCSSHSSASVCNPTFDIPVSLSIDGGYSWISSTFLAYAQSKACPSSGSLLIPSFLLALFSLLFVY